MTINFKHFYLIVDTETTGAQTVADFGAVVVDRHGKVFDELGVLVSGEFGENPMHWALGNPKTTERKYRGLLATGHRMLATVPAINRWLARIRRQYNPVLTAYCLGFDFGKCANTDIDLAQFDQRFCLRNAAKIIVQTPEYEAWCHENDAFTPSGRLSEKADHVAQFVDPTLPPEPHTALEDARDYENPILHRIIHLPKTKLEILAQGAGKSPSTKWML